MKTAQKIIDLFGGLQALRNNSIKLEVQGFMPLSIEFIGAGPRNLPLVSVMHFYTQHGDLMRDPDMEFEVDGQGEWHPISYRQDSLCKASISPPVSASFGVTEHGGCCQFSSSSSDN